MDKANFQYDENGTIFFVILSFLALILFPILYYLWPTRKDTNFKTSIFYSSIYMVQVPYYATLEIYHLLIENYKTVIKALAAFVIAFLVLGRCYFNWIGLGILSSIGLGFGMHTFVLFLAPHIASVTLAAQSCKSLDFQTPPYPDKIICPTTQSSQLPLDSSLINPYTILNKVAVECFMWGLGTAIGELPPYFAARFQAKAKHSKDEPLRGWQKMIADGIKKVGFFGILLCASIPNPLFDAAGIASGTAQMPFVTFFGATFIGKAIIKMLIQSTFVIFLFYGNHLETLVEKYAPTEVSMFIVNTLETQRNNVLARKIDQHGETWISWAFGNLVSLIIILFVVSVLKTLSDRYIERAENRHRNS